MAPSDDLQSRRFCYAICQKFFGGCWSRSEFQDGAVVRLSGSLSNELYVCSVSTDDTVSQDPPAATVSSPPKRVLVRLYGLSSNDPQAVLQDCLLFALLAERGLGPKFYGCFQGGRLEEFIESRCLTTRELADPRLSTEIARKMASLHQVSMPLCREPVILQERLTRWQVEGRKSKKAPSDIDASALWRRIAGFGLGEEIRFLLHLLYTSNSPVVFCHNDLQEGNVLLKDDGTDELIFIDFEYAAYNFRGFDIANHFCEWMYNYTSVQPPFFTASLDDYPSEAQQVLFIRRYLEALNTPAASLEYEVQSLLREVSTFALASHMWWALWALMSARKSRIKFGYLEYALARLDGYQIFKQRLLEKYPDISKESVRQETDSEHHTVVLSNCATVADRLNIAVGHDLNYGSIASGVPAAAAGGSCCLDAA